MYLEDYLVFMSFLKYDIKSFIKKADKEDVIPCVRLNGTSDVPWEHKQYINGTLMEQFPDLQFYDYTKSWKRAYQTNFPTNYHLTVSRSEKTKQSDIFAMVKSKRANVAVVFRGEVPTKWDGMEVIDGTKDDLRFLDKKGVIVGLTALGDGKKDTSGFVVDI